jgi:hypothetical protein
MFRNNMPDISTQNWNNVIEQQNVIRDISVGTFTGHQLGDSSMILSKALANGWNVVWSVSFIDGTHMIYMLITVKTVCF